MQYELTVDKEFDDLCPALTDEELRLLEASIKEHGCRDEITIWANHNKTVIDGHNRYAICQKLGKPYKTSSLEFKSKDEVKAWMLRNQMGRRNLTDSQRGMMAARLTTLANGSNQHTKEGGPIGPPSISEAAEQAAVGASTIKRAKQVIANGTPELQKMVTDGDVAVSAAAEVATLPKSEQKKVVAKGAEAVTAKARAKRAAKKSKPAEKDYGKCPNCASTKWADGDEGVACAKCHHPHGEPAGEVDSQRVVDARSKTIKTAEALMRAFDDLNLLAPHPKEHSHAIATCKILLTAARNWK